MSRVLLICLLFCSVATTVAQIVNIPDANFKAHLVNYDNPVIDTNGDGEIQVSEAEAFDNFQLNLGNAEISDLTGLEAFVNLVNLYSFGNLFTEIDLSALVALTDLGLSEENLTSVNFLNAFSLNKIFITSNDLFDLDLSDQINLEQLVYLDDFENPNLSTIILPPTSTLTDLIVTNTLIESIDLSNNSSLVKIELREGNLNSIDLSNLTILDRLDVTGNNLSEIDVSQNNNITRLTISDQNITNIDISNLTQLEVFRFDRNNISEVDITNNLMLKVITAYETNIETLDYSLHNQLEALNISNTLIETVDFSNNPLIETLSVSGLDLDVIDITVLPLLDLIRCENTSLLEIDFSQNTNLRRAQLSYSQFEEIDFSNSNSLNFIDVRGSFNLESINIKNLSLLELNIEASNNPNLNFICVDDIPLAIAQNFNIPPFTTFVDDCALATGELNYIEGLVTYDANDNNCGAGAVPLNNYLINANNGTSNFANTTNTSGEYSIKVSEGTYTTQVLGLPPYYDASPATATSTFMGFNQTDTANFCIQPNTTANDLTVSIFPVTGARPGFEAEYEILYENVGTTTLTGEVTVAFSDVQVDFVTATPAPINQTSNSLTFNVGTLAPFQQESILATFLLEQPPVNQSGQTLPYTVTITPLAGDAMPANNEFYFPQIIVNSFDPNDKTCVQGHQVLFADADNYLHYIVRFQNLGTASAINVRVVDVLDALLDFETFKVLTASHDMQTIVNDGQIDFIFDNINLPPEITDPEGSNGYVTFKIKPVSTIALNDEVNNRADIYFDFNAPIFTNTTSTTFVDVLGIEEATALDIVVFPNPASTVVNIQTASAIQAIELSNTLGQRIKSIQISADKKQVDISALASGLYFMKVATVDGEGVYRVVKN